jgi:hypothetical protein
VFALTEKYEKTIKCKIIEDIQQLPWLPKRPKQQNNVPLVIQDWVTSTVQYLVSEKKN